MRKYNFLLIFLSVLLFVTSLMIGFYHFKLESSYTYSELHLPKIKVKIDKFNQYELNNADSEFLKNLFNTIKSGEERFAAELDVLKSLMYFLGFISLSQGVTTIFLMIKNRKT